MSRNHQRLTVRVRYFMRHLSEQPGGCWLWTGTINYKGYGSFSNTFAHRFSYFLHRGPLTPGLVIDHLCRNRACVNPRHLELVTMRENYYRGEHWAARGVCRRGHQVTPENTVVWTRNGTSFRCCKQCRRKSQRAWVLRQRGCEIPSHSLPFRLAS